MSIFKPIKKAIRKRLTREAIFKFIIIISSIALVASSVLPYIIGI